MARSGYDPILAGKEVDTMRKFNKYFAWFVIILYFALGIWLLVSPRFSNLSQEVKVIFAVFLFLYGGYRLVRLWAKNREENEE